MHLLQRRILVFLCNALYFAPVSSVSSLMLLFFPHVCSFIHTSMLCSWACSGLNYKEMINPIQGCYKNASSCIMKHWPHCSWRLFSDLNGEFLPISPAVSYVSFINMILEQKRHQDLLWDVERTSILQSELLSISSDYMWFGDTSTFTGALSTA